MLKKLFFCLFMMPPLFASIDQKEIKLVNKLRKQYKACQKYMIKRHGRNVKITDALIIEGYRNELKKYKAHHQLAEYRLKILEMENRKLKAKLKAR